MFGSFSSHVSGCCRNLRGRLLLQIAQRYASAKPCAFDSPGGFAAGGGRCDASFVDQLLHVAGDHAAMRAGRLRKRKIRAGFFSQRACARRNFSFGLFCRNDGSGLLCLLFGNGRSVFRLCGRVFARNKRGRILSRFANHSNVFKAGNVVAFFAQDRKQNARFFRFLVESGLIRLVGEKNISR